MDQWRNADRKGGELMAWELQRHMVPYLAPSVSDYLGKADDPVEECARILTWVRDEDADADSLGTTDLVPEVEREGWRSFVSEIAAMAEKTATTSNGVHEFWVDPGGWVSIPWCSDAAAPVPGSAYDYRCDCSVPDCPHHGDMREDGDLVVAPKENTMQANETKTYAAVPLAPNHRPDPDDRWADICSDRQGRTHRIVWNAQTDLLYSVQLDGVELGTFRTLSAALFAVAGR